MLISSSTLRMKTVFSETSVHFARLHDDISQKSSDMLNIHKTTIVVFVMLRDEKLETHLMPHGIFFAPSRLSFGSTYFI
jgi:hypothetical protein